jgi:hypothetical protein
MTPKEAGMQAAYFAEGDAWFEQLKVVLEEVGSTHPYFTADDLNDAGLPRSRALGSALTLAAREGLISRVERDVRLDYEVVVRAFLMVASTNENAHNAPITLWRSHFFVK